MTSELVATIAALPDLSGTLTFHGEWFGRPFDNHHVVTGAVDLPGGAVEIGFADAGERLVLHRPRGVDMTGDPAHGGRPGTEVFTVRSVRSLTWHWTWYGRPDLPENAATITHVVRGPFVTVTETGPDGTRRRHILRRRHAAVALLRFRTS
jgi:hypothetical protein